MSLTSFLWNEAVVHRVGWTLLHLVWQGAAVAALFVIASAALRRRSANIRYVAGCMAMLVLAAAPVATFLALPVPADTGGAGAARLAPALQPIPVAPPTAERLPVAGARVESTPAPPRPALARPADAVAVQPERIPWRERVEAWLRPILPWCVAAWLAGVVVLSFWHIAAWVQVQRSRHAGTEPVAATLGAAARRLAEALGIGRAVRLLASARVAAPMAIGWLRPVVLLPASALAGLAPDQIEAILAHELAHIRRYDYLVNLLQTVVETLLFYHPAVWWISRRVRVEREHCCDDLAVAACGDRVVYARALASLAGQRLAPRPAVAATGGSLLDRIRHVLGLQPSRPVGRRTTLAGILVLGLLLTLAILYGCSLDGGSASAEPKGEQPEAPVDTGWSQPIKGLRIRALAEAGTQYRRGEPLPLTLEMQNVSEAPIPYAELTRQVAVKAYDQAGKWLGVPRLDVAVSPWEERPGALAPKEVLRWTIWLDRLRFVRLGRPLQPGASVQLRFSVPAQIVVPGELPRESYTPPLVVKLNDAPPSNPEPDDVPEKWTRRMDLVWREGGDLTRSAFAVHIDGNGLVTMVRRPSPNDPANPLPPRGRTEVKLDRECLDRLAKRMRDLKIWELAEHKEGPARIDELEISLSLAFGGTSIVGDFPLHVVEKQPALRELRKEVHGLIAAAAGERPASSGRPDRADGAWSAPAGGLEGRLVLALPRISETDWFALKLELRNVGEVPLAVQTGNPFLLDVRVADAKGQAVKPTWTRSDVLFSPKWAEVAPKSSLSVQVSEKSIDGAKGSHLDVTTSIWKLEPGKYRVSATYKWPEQGTPDDSFRYKGNAKLWSGQLALPEIEVEVLRDQPWGEAVEGVQARLRAEKAQWKAGETPELKADLRNQGKSVQSSALQQVEVDGAWYGLLDRPRGPSLIRPGQTLSDIVVTLGRQMRHVEI